MAAAVNAPSIGFAAVWAAGAAPDSAASAAVVLNKAFRLSERSWSAAAAALALGVLAGAVNAGSTMVRLPKDAELTLRGGSGSRFRLSGTVVCARTSSMETSLAGRYPPEPTDVRA